MTNVDAFVPPRLCNSIEFWQLCDTLTVVQAALLIAGEAPLQPKYIDKYLPGGRHRSTGFNAVMAALVKAIETKQLAADSGGNTCIVNWDDSTIRMKDLRAWLKSRGFTTGFFFP